MNIELLCVVLLVVYVVYIVRLIWVLPFFRSYGSGNDESIDRRGPLNVFVFLGSGGHTGEMLRLVENYKKMVLAKGNTVYVGYSDEKSRIQFIQQVASENEGCRFEYRRLKKAREVNAGLFTSLVSVLQTLVQSLAVIFKVSRAMSGKPHLVLLNGPGTCCVIAIWFKVIEWLNLFQPSSNIVYVESLARITSLSLTGKLLYWIADLFIVQWEELCLTHPRAKYYGVLV
ncbi:hypothetical protein HG537_0D04460 [Torulaspora globosa]|uniref:UDP-N-acetylglucosamine transferase subunit ALG14 n=1 Tax=Torulaspora globosa TaxID=48254 RepID=A0A7H9HTN5_9SACH|nr:hypothetical protein HG537_0D04460 [Torulaspora sp. CBS 2947]